VISRATFGWNTTTETEAFNHATKELKEAIKLLNTQLQGKDYLVGNRLTVADIVAAVALILPN
jgi:glutathione S-transferase